MNMITLGGLFAVSFKVKNDLPPLPGDGDQMDEVLGFMLAYPLFVA